jgi:hypothetical protein
MSMATKIVVGTLGVSLLLSALLFGNLIIA